MSDTDLLIVGAHPDDAEIGCGGLISKTVAMGKKVVIIDLTNGEPTPYGDPITRAKEAKKSAEILGIFSRLTLEWPNRYLENKLGYRIQLGDIFRKFRPKVVITHPNHDWHADHIHAHELVNAARFQAKLSKTDSEYPPYWIPQIFYFEHSHLKKPRELDFTVDVSPYFAQKIEALKTYHSQFTANPANQHLIKNLEDRAQWLESQSGVKYAEGFISPEIICLTDVFFSPTFSNNEVTKEN